MSVLKAILYRNIGRHLMNFTADILNCDFKGLFVMRDTGE